MELVCETDHEDEWDGPAWRNAVSDVYDLLGSMCVKQLMELKQYILENY